jgi:hypothetical protein
MGALERGKLGGGEFVQREEIGFLHPGGVE